MTTRERLVELLSDIPSGDYRGNLGFSARMAGTIADHLIANGVTVQEWHPVSELPKEPGQYCLIILNREMNQKTGKIEDGVAPIHDEFWDYHANNYGQLSDGRWWERTPRVWDGYSWGGYCEHVIAWTEMPQPPKGVE